MNENNHINSLMSEDELAALNDPETSPEEQAALRSTDGNPDDEAASAQAQEDAAAAVAKTAEGTPQEAEQQAAVQEESAPAAPQQTAPKFKADLPEDFEARSEAAKTKGAELAQQFRNGDITFDEYDAQRVALDAEREALQTAKLKADLYADMNQQTAAQQWQAEIAKFTADVKTGDGIDYQADKERGEDLDMFVKALASKPENEDKSMRWFLDEAHKRVLAIHGKPAAAAAAAPAGKQAATPPARKPDTSAAPKTLADVPAAGGDEPVDTGGEFAHLDALSGEALESAIEKMSPAQRERYLAA